MTQKTCKHPVFPILRKILIALDIKSCPSCLIRHYIHDITELQAALERRGGIFVSRDAALNERLGYSREKDLHRDLVRRWRITKIDLHRHLSQLEALQEEGAGKARWSIQLEKAFELWHEVEIECSRVPGYRDVEVDSGDDTEEALTVEVHHEHDLDLCEDTGEQQGDKDRHTDNPKDTSEEDTAYTVHATSSPTDKQEDVDMEVASNEDTDCATSDSDETTLLGMEGVTLRPKPKVYWDRSNPYDLLRDMDTDEEEPSPSSPPVNDRSFPRPMDQTAQSTSAATSPTPPAKRRRISNPNPHVSIHPLVTTMISPSPSPSPSPFDPPPSSPFPGQSPTYHHPHPLHTTAETARKRTTFWRRTKAYVPFMWAVSGGRELLDTSFYRMSWEEYEKLEDRNKDEEDCGEPMVGKEEVEEQEVGEEDTAERRAERRAERKAERKAEKKAAKKAERQAEKGVKRRRSYVDVAEWCKNLTE